MATEEGKARTLAAREASQKFRTRKRHLKLIEELRQGGWEIIATPPEDVPLEDIS